MKKAVIFDLDGTLADTLASLTYCGNRALNRFGFPSFGEQDYKYFVGDGAAVLIRRALERAGDEGLAHFDEVYQEYLRIFARDCMYQVRPYEGIPSLLQELKKRGIRTAVLSNKPHANTLHVVADLFGKASFDQVQGQQEGVPRKPAPDGVYHIERALGVTPQDCLYVGDTAVDMETGNAAGIHTVGVLWGFRDRAELEEAGACSIIDRPAQLLELLESSENPFPPSGPRHEGSMEQGKQSREKDRQEKGTADDKTDCIGH